MQTSEYFLNLTALYEAEIEDLQSDTDGRNVLAKRLKEKRAQLPQLLPMLDYSPEMVAPAFFGAFSFASPAPMAEVLRRAPQDDGFPTWAALAPTVAVAPWAQPLVTTVLAEADGDTFLVVTAALEFLRRHGRAAVPADTPPAAPTRRLADEEDDNEQDDGIDLAEAGNDWLAEQGFDRLDSQ